MVKMAVGTKPALIGKKLRLHYTRGPRFFEIDIDIGSSSVASRILTVVSSQPPLLFLLFLLLLPLIQPSTASTVN